MFDFLKKFFKSQGKEEVSKQAEDSKKAPLDYKKVLEKHMSLIESTIKPYIYIKIEKANSLELWQSKFGGIPYLPKDREYPKNSQGGFLRLLAQINFSEARTLELFPNKGLLQLWIADDELYGLDFSSNKQDSFRVIYYPEVETENLQTDLSFLPEQELFPISNETACALKFEIRKAPITYTDYRFNDKMGDVAQDDDFFDAYMAFYSAQYDDEPSHKIEGYPNFAQIDPREINEEHQDKDVLLLQIDSDPQNGVMWGDMGIGNFFISEKDLKNRGFSNVLYNWDC